MRNILFTGILLAGLVRAQDSAGNAEAGKRLYIFT